MKNKPKKKWYQAYLANNILIELLTVCDIELAEMCRRPGCLFCGAKLHGAKYKRKPRNRFDDRDSEYVYRFSFCCSREGCRKRHTPPSLRFLGRKVYWGVVVILVSAMRHGLTPQRVKELRNSLGINRRTLERWREWWLEHFVESPFWKAARARFAPSLNEKALPWSLCLAFGIEPRERLINLLEFLSPITTTWSPPEVGF